MGNLAPEHPASEAGVQQALDALRYARGEHTAISRPRRPGGVGIVWHGENRHQHRASGPVVQLHVCLSDSKRFVTQALDGPHSPIEELAKLQQELLRAPAQAIDAADVAVAGTGDETQAALCRARRFEQRERFSLALRAPVRIGARLFGRSHENQLITGDRRLSTSSALPLARGLPVSVVTWSLAVAAAAAAAAAVVRGRLCCHSHLSRLRGWRRGPSARCADGSPRASVLTFPVAPRSLW